MRILIVDDDVISSSKLKLVFSKYGECDVASSGSQAVDMFGHAQEASAPYGFISVEMDMKDMIGVEVVEEIRKWETQHPEEAEQQVRVLLIVSESDQAELTKDTDLFQDNATAFILKPYNRQKLETILENMGMEKAPTPPPQREPDPEKNRQTPKEVAPKELEAILNKITTLVTRAEQLKDVEIGKILEELVEQGGNEAELLMARYMSSDKLAMETRTVLVQVAGNTRSPHFLVPLNKMIHAEDNIKMIQEAVLAVAKYNNQRALNILNQGLQKFKHPMLLSTLRAEIAKIKQNQPVLSILPRFLQSYKNLKNFRVTIDIIKKIITPADTGMFISYLKSGNPAIEDGTFEILCHTGDSAIKTALFNFFEDRVQKIPCLKEPECSPLLSLLNQLQRYLLKQPAFIDEQTNEMMELFPLIKDISSKQLIISILSRSQRPEVLDFIKQVYTQEEKLQEHIIDRLSGNQKAVDFLFEKYHQGQALKENVITSLLKTEQGLRYFIQHFFTFELEKQELILKSLTFSNQDYLMDFIKKIYDTQLYSLKFHLLNLLKDHYLFSFKEILFDADNQREFMFMGKDYLDTIFQLFPVTSLKLFYEKIAHEDLSNIKIKKYLARITGTAAAEPVVDFSSAKLIDALFNRVTITNNTELNVLFFSSLENLRILDLKSYRYLVEATNTFVETRGANITEKEKTVTAKIKSRLKDQLNEIRDIENVQKEINGIFANKPIELQRLEKLIEINHLGAAVKIHHVAAYLCSKFNNPALVKKDDQELFYFKFPFLAELMKHLWSLGEVKPSEDWSDTSAKMELLKPFKDRLRVKIEFKSRRATAFIRDQLQEILPELQVESETGSEPLQETDILVCDAPCLKQRVEKKEVTTRRIYLYLENRMDFAPFREYSPKVFLKPLSGYRIVKLILQELYLQK